MRSERSHTDFAWFPMMINHWRFALCEAYIDREPKLFRSFFGSLFPRFFSPFFVLVIRVSREASPCHLLFLS